MSRLIAIVGRPNVGKSTLFNRICGGKNAIVRDVPGVTRDRHYRDAEWSGHSFILIDTGGFEPDAEDELLSGMRAQAELAVEEAAGIIFVVDSRDGLTTADEEIARQLRRSGTPTVIAANKIDSMHGEETTGVIAEIARLGFDAHPISAEHGRGVGDLLDALLEAVVLPRIGEEEPEAETGLRLAVIGRPNVGKSTLLNALLGEERFLATEVAGTTRDSLDATLRYQKETFILTDTAGIRRRKSISQDLERYTVIRSLKSVENSDVAVLVLDATEVAVSQDARLAKLVVDRGKGLVIAVNKWDLILESDEGEGPDALRARVRETLPEVRHAPIVLTSALEGKRVFKLLDEVRAVHVRQTTRIPTAELNRWLEQVTGERPPPLVKGRPNRFFYATQVGRAPPKFVLTCSRPADVPDHYQRYLVNRLRDTYPLEGVTLRLTFKGRSGR
ncbi:MAG: ribosome biogenesis GTPase Der [Deltaproteobacteria bacterium]|nr:ribosome biogenesis GTPase Der [Deltaproteobacteria bacterium]